MYTVHCKEWAYLLIIIHNNYYRYVGSKNINYFLN